LSLYTVLTYRLLARYAKSAPNDGSLEEGRLGWLWFLVACFTSAVVFAVLNDLFIDLVSEVIGWNLYWFFISIVIFAIVYVVFSKSSVWKKRKTGAAISRKKYLKTALDHVRLIEYQKRLEAAMEGMVFLDPELTLPVLAKKIHVPPHHLSQVINQNGSNFYEYMNLRRCEYARRMIERRPPQIKIAEIAFDSGFNSISTFNTTFKRLCGITPSEWKNFVRSREKHR
jgi:AraC-like DNA-binding protein